MNSTPTPLSIPAIMDLATAFHGSSVLFSALELDLFTHISEAGSADVETLAQRIGTPKRSLRLLLDACVALGLLIKTHSIYILTPATSSTLVRGGSHDLTRAINDNRAAYPRWGELTRFVKTGKPVEPEAPHSDGICDDARRTAYAMHSKAMSLGKLVVPMLGIRCHEKILDVVGGSGTFAMLMAQQAPEVTCETQDIPTISTVAMEIIARAGLTERVTCRPGNYHTDTYPPDTYDLVTIFCALHKEDPAMILNILRNAYAALRPGGRIAILDLMTGPDHTSPPFSALFAVDLALSSEDNCVFSDKELRAWLMDAGFVSPYFCQVPPPMPHWLAMAWK